jgi:hypothetical protein
MATVLIIHNSDGSRRCDAKCHDATEPECDCICGGRYHGKTSEGAMNLIHEDVQSGRFGAELAHVAHQLTTQTLQNTLF